jgi:phasin
MAPDPQFEASSQMREFAERNIEQVRAAYAQYMAAARKAQHMMASMVSANPLTSGMKQVQERMMEFTQQNIETGFSLASALARATDLKDALEIQSRHAHQQIPAYSLQAQEFGRLLAGAAQNAPAELRAAGQAP